MSRVCQAASAGAAAGLMHPAAGGARVLVIAPHGSYRTAPFIETARRHGIDLLVASEGRHSIVSEYARGLHIDPRDPRAALASIQQEARRRPFAGIIGTDDSTAELAARAASGLGLAHNDPRAVHIARRKDLARARLAEAGLPVPGHVRLDLGQVLRGQLGKFRFPGVVKPLALSASQGVIRVDDRDQLQRACERIAAMLQDRPDLSPRERSSVLLETFIPGFEVAVEGMLYGGRLELLAVFDKPDPLDGPYFEETYYLTPSRLDGPTQARLRQVIAAACAAYGLREGPVHAECRINPQGVWILEVAARTIGGLCARLLRFGAGHNLEELVLAHAMGVRLPCQPREGASGVLMIPIPRAGILRRVEGLLAAQRVPCIQELQIQIRPGHELVPLPEGASYLGFVFARAGHPERVEAALREAHACLKIVVAPLWKARVTARP
jgi:biotin carboxylase